MSKVYEFEEQNGGTIKVVLLGRYFKNMTLIVLTSK